jgi:hypothetical protein
MWPRNTLVFPRHSTRLLLPRLRASVKPELECHARVLKDPHPVPRIVSLELTPFVREARGAVVFELTNPQLVTAELELCRTDRQLADFRSSEFPRITRPHGTQDSDRVQVAPNIEFADSNVPLRRIDLNP